MIGRSVKLLVGVLLCAVSVPVAPVLAQREQLSLRVEQFGAAALPLDRRSAPAPVDLRLWQVTATAGVRSLLDADGNTVLTNGVFYRRSEVDVRARGAASNADVVTALYYDFLALRTLNDRHTLAVAVRPGLFGDLRGGLGDDFRVEGAVFVDRVVTPRTTVGLGMSYTSNFGRVLPVPVLHVVHRRGRRLLVDGLLPSRLDVWYFPRKGLELGVNAQLSGFQYHLETDPQVPVLRPLPGGGAEFAFQPNTLQLANAIVGPQVRWNPVGKWYLSLDAGVTVLRRLIYGRGDAPGVTPRNTGLVRLGVQRMY